MNVRQTLSGSLAAVFLLGFGFGCGPEDQAETEMTEEETLPEPGVEPIVADTTAEALWAYLESADYQNTWPMWPGKAPYYEGTQPHGALLTTYANDSAMVGLTAMRTEAVTDNLPFGSIIVKENYMPDSTLAAVTVMMKAEMYDPDHHDWFWMKRLADGTVEASGRVQSCIDCHSEAADNWDYLITALNQWGAS
jgi:hypothetical protein